MKIKNKMKIFKKSISWGDAGYDDLYSCLEYNTPKKINTDNIRGIIAEVCGANDESDWWWILKMKNGTYALMSARCDYTGWDCQSGIYHESLHRTLMGAVRKSPGKEKYSNRNIRKNLLRQIENKQVFGTEEL